MERLIKEIQPLVASLRNDLKQLDKRINHYNDNLELNPEEFAFYKGTIDECHAEMRNKMHILTTMLETDSTEILEMIMQRDKHKARLSE